MPNFRQDAPRLAADWGIHLRGITGYHDANGMALDAAPTFNAVTQANSGIPAIVNTMIDPQVIRSLLTPTRSEEIYGTAKKGDRRNKTIMFPVIEGSADVVAYGDYNNAGRADANANWVNRQSFYFQTWAGYGDLESEMLAMADISIVTERRTYAALGLNKQSNLMNLFGISGLELYGALNDPNLLPAVQPTLKAVGSSTQTSWAGVSDPVAIYGDFVALFTDLNTQLMGNIDNTTPLEVVLPSEKLPSLKTINSFGLTLEDMLKTGFPNMTIRALPEAGTAMSGGYNSTTQMQMFVRSIDGVESVTTAFTEKLTMHRLEAYSTYQRQKMSQGGWGTIWRRPAACATMIGI